MVPLTPVSCSLRPEPAANGAANLTPESEVVCIIIPEPATKYKESASFVADKLSKPQGLLKLVEPEVTIIFCQEFSFTSPPVAVPSLGQL